MVAARTAHPDKEPLRAALLAVLAAELSACEAAHRSTVDGATHAEARAENAKDTRSLEQSYLARGQALRAVALREAIEAVRSMPLGDFRGRRAALGALGTLEDDDGAARVVWLVPDGAGALLDNGLRAVSVTTPLGRALIGCSEGDAVAAPRAGAQVHYTLTSLV